MSAGLPLGWTDVSLGELLREPLAAGRSGSPVLGGVPVLRLPALRSSTVDLTESREGPWATATEAAQRLIRPGDILISRNGGPGARIGRAALVREITGPITYPATMVRVRVDERLIDPEYLVLSWESRAVRRQIESSVRQGSGLHHIALRDLERVRLPLPPHAEQERIKSSLAFWLARVDGEEAAVRDTLRRMENLRSLVIDHGVVGRTAPGPHADPEPSTTTVAHRAPLPAIPAGWRWVLLGELAEVARGPMADNRRTEERHGVEVGSLRPAELRGERWTHEGMPTVRLDAHTAEANRLRPGDVLFVLSGQPDSLGLGRVWEQDSSHRMYVPNHHVARVRMAGDALHPRLLALYANGVGRRRLRNTARITAGVASLGLDQLRQTPVPVPPLSEQGALLASLEAWDGGLTFVTASAEEALAMADRLRDGCREQAFAGRLPYGAAPNSENDARPEGAVTVPQTTPARRPVDQPSEVQRRAEQLWSSFPLLSDDGLTALEYVEQVAYLLCLKVAQELRRRPLNRVDVLGRDAWDELALREGTALIRYYGTLLAELGEHGGVIGRIFHKARNPLRRPMHLQNLVQQVGEELAWWDERPEWRAPVFDAFLASSGQRHRSGAGQFFTHRGLVDAIVACTRPTVEDTIVDPAAGTGGFLVRSFEHIARHLPPGVSPTQRKELSHGAIRGTELVAATARLATVNLLLHGVERLDGDRAAIEVRDSLAVSPGRRLATLVLTDPPLGQRRSTIPSTGAPGLQGEEEDLAITRPDFWATTGHQQLDFLQHVYTLLEIGGRAAVVVPDGVLFRGGAGELVRKQLLKQCDVHTLLRLPVGVSGASSGVKLNVLFFEKAAARPDGSPATRRLWVYDLRTGRSTAADAEASMSSGLDAFVAAYRPGHPPNTRAASLVFKPYSVDALLARPGVSLDVGADLREEETRDTLEPHLIAQQISGRLEDAWRRFSRLAEELTPASDARTFRSG